MASLLNVEPAELDRLASKHTNIYNISPRCGVFAKTDVQPLLSEGAAREDIAMSILTAVVKQTVSGLACGRPISGKVAFLGGPLHFFHCLRKCFIDTLGLSDDNVVFPPFANSIVCRGAAIDAVNKVKPMPFKFLYKRIAKVFSSASVLSSLATLPPLFSSEDELKAFRARHAQHTVQKVDLASASGPLFLGMDSGSTTLKMTLIDKAGQLLYSFYEQQQGEHRLVKALEAIMELHVRISELPAFIAAAAVTGYGEHLLKTAIRADVGVVETVAHLRAARFFQPETDCVLVRYYCDFIIKLIGYWWSRYEMHASG